MSWPGRPAADWLSVEDARTRVLALVAALPAEEVPLSDALGRALAEPVAARATLPPWDNSAMDGYAVRGIDVAGASPSAPIELRVVGEARAGEGWDGAVGPGQAVRVMTGGPVPDGTDSVVRVEDTDGEAARGRVRVRSDRDRGRNVRPRGQDMRVGDYLVERGDPLTPGALGLVAAAGQATVSVHRRPLLGLLTSGDELRGTETFADVMAGRGIPDSNGPMLAAAAAELGVDTVMLGPVADRADDVRACVERARDHGLDLLVTVGGASMGATDLFRGVLTDLGVAFEFWRVRIRPGSPFSAALLPRAGVAPLPVLGLPGNPASAFVTFQLFVRPALLALAGHRDVHLPVIPACAGAPLQGGGELTHFLRVRLDQTEDGLVATPTGPQGSGLVRGLARADGLAIVPPGADSIADGEPVSVMLLRLPYAAQAATAGAAS